MTDSAIPAPAKPDNEIYGIFAGPIDQAAVARVANGAAVASSNGVTHCHLAFQSSGGTVPDGVALYNLLRAFPVPITLYNIGSIASAGVIAYLGAGIRVSSRLATFMIHRTTSPPQGMTSERLRATVRSVEIDDARTEEILRGISLTKENRDVHQIADLWLSSAEAKEVGLVTEIAEFAPPKGTSLFFLGAA